MAMTEERRKEIALLVVEQMVMERGIPAGDTLRREVGNIGQKIGVSTQELMDFYESMVPKVIAKTFGYTKVSINSSGSRFRVNQ